MPNGPMLGVIAFAGVLATIAIAVLMGADIGTDIAYTCKEK